MDDQLAKCMDLERNFKAKILNSQQPYLRDAYATILAIEQGSVCERVSNSSEELSYQTCLDMSDQIRKQGLSTYYFDIFKSIKQLYLE